jgi:signal peptidase I
MNNDELRVFKPADDSEGNNLAENEFLEEAAEVEAVSAEDIESENKSSGKKVFKKLEKGTTAYEIFDWIRTICIGVLAGIFIVVFLIQRDDVYGSSMMPTLSQGDILFTQKLSNYFSSYKRGDIVVLDGSGMEGYTKKEYLIKRIVGLPGETVRIADGNVYIKPADSNEFYLLQENYLPAGTKTIVMDDGRNKGYDEITLGEDEYFCLGDNRPVSNDSRSLGPFEKKRIIAVAVIRVFPLNEIKLL